VKRRKRKGFLQHETFNEQLKRRVTAEHDSILPHETSHSDDKTRRTSGDTSGKCIIKEHFYDVLICKISAIALTN